MFSSICRKSGTALPLFAVLICFSTLLSAQTGGPASEGPLTERERAMLERIELLEKRLAVLEEKSTPVPSGAPQSSGPDPAATRASALPTGTGKADDEAVLDKRVSVLGFVPGATLNFYFDGHYGYNYNRPVGRVNLLRANDVVSDNLTLNQVALILERAPDIAQERRFGGRLDLMFGQNT